MSKKKWLLVIVLLLAAGICAGVGIFWMTGGKSKSISEDLSEYVTEEAQEETQESETAEEETQDMEESADETGESAETVGDLEIDFEALQEINEDIYAWIDIPGTEISYPVLQHPTDEEYYLKRDIYGNSDSNGSLFTQATYNSDDFSDPVTVIYGHNMKSGAMFGNLQEIYSDSEKFEEYKDVYIYLPDEVLHYEIFAAVTYSDIHILDYYDFGSAYQFDRFIYSLSTVRGIGVNYDDEVELAYGDRVIVLSTCQPGGSGRFLVVAKLDSN